MKLIDFYKEIKNTFKNEKMEVGFFVDPTLHHSYFTNVQLIYPGGQIYPPLNIRATELVSIQPLSGPFYDLDLEGLSVSFNKENGLSYISAVVKFPNGKLGCSSAITIKKEKKEVIEELSKIKDNLLWYTIDTLNKDWKYEIDELVQEIIVELC